MAGEHTNGRTDGRSTCRCKGGARAVLLVRPGAPPLLKAWAPHAVHGRCQWRRCTASGGMPSVPSVPAFTLGRAHGLRPYLWGGTIDAQLYGRALGSPVAHALGAWGAQQLSSCCGWTCLRLCASGALRGQQDKCESEELSAGPKLGVAQARLWNCLSRWSFAHASNRLCRSSLRSPLGAIHLKMDPVAPATARAFSSARHGASITFTILSVYIV